MREFDTRLFCINRLIDEKVLTLEYFLIVRMLLDCKSKVSVIRRKLFQTMITR